MRVVQGRRRRSTGIWVVVATLAALTGATVNAPAAFADPGDITTFAGGGIGDGGPAPSAALLGPMGVDVDAAGNLYIADTENHRIRKVDTSGIITTVAGTGQPGFSGDRRAATSATLRFPVDVVVDADGSLYIADRSNFRVRKVTPAGIIGTIAGNGTFDPFDRVNVGDGGPATSASVVPAGLALDAENNLYIADSGNHRVRKVDASGTITTVAGTGAPCCNLGDGGPATSAQLNGPNDVVLDAAGNLYIAADDRVRKVDTSGTITTVAGTGSTCCDLGEGGPATQADIAPAGIAVDAGGNLFIADSVSYRVRRVDPAGIITTVAGTGVRGFSGDGGPAVDARFDVPQAIAIDAAGNLFIVDSEDSIGIFRGNNRVRKVDTNGIVTTVAGGGDGEGGPATEARLEFPAGVEVDGSGDVFISEKGFISIGGRVQEGARVSRVDAAGIITTVAGTGFPGFSGDGGPATSAALSVPLGMSADAAGNLFIFDCGNSRIRRVDASGVITTVVGGGAPADGLGDGGPATSAALSCPLGTDFEAPTAAGVFVVTSGTDPAPGTLFLTDPGNNRVRKVDPLGTISTVAGTGEPGFSGDGGPATSAQLDNPTDVVLDGQGNLYIADTGSNRVRKVDASGTISTVAGNGTRGFGGNGVPATSVPVASPTGVDVDDAGTLFIAEYGFHRVRTVDASGTISTIAGIGNPGFEGDGGPATSAQLSAPSQVALNAAGDVFIADTNNQRVRRVEAGEPEPAPEGGCGQVITEDTELSGDIGPCASDGVVIGADDITLDLNGHRVFGTSTSGDGAGIRLTDRSGVTITGGDGPAIRGSSIVSGFDAGIALIGGSGNTVSNLRVEDNVGPNDGAASLGDGIALFFSGDNRILDNVVARNGIFDGIAVLGEGSNNNLIQGNFIGRTFGGRESFGGVGIVVNAFLNEFLPREVSVFNNRIIDNTIRRNDNAGISTLSNINGVIADNEVTNNGGEDYFPNNGIGVRALIFAERVTTVLVEGNEVHGNFNNGIEVESEQNTIRNNDAANNRGVDLYDFNEDCDANVWTNNVWGSGGFFPDCASGTDQPAAEDASPAPLSPVAGPTASGAEEEMRPADPPLRTAPPR